MNASSPEIQWFIARDGKQYGPVSDVEMRKLVELGHMKPEDLVWRPGFPDWRPSAAVFQPPATPPAPTPPTAPTAAPQPHPPQGQPAQQPQQQPASYPAAAPQPTANPRQGPVGAPSAGPNSSPNSGPNSGPSPGPNPGLSAGPAAGPMTGPKAGPMVGPGAGPAAGAMAGPAMGAPGPHPVAGPATAAPMGSPTGPQGPQPQQWPAMGPATMGPATGRPGPGIPVSTIPTGAPNGAPKSATPQQRPGDPNVAHRPTTGPAAGPAGPIGGAAGPAPRPQPAFQPIPAGSPHGTHAPNQATHATQPSAGAPYPQQRMATQPAQPAPSPSPQPASLQPGALQPISATPDFEEEPTAPPRRRRGARLFAVAVVVLSLAAVGGYVVSKGGPQQALSSLGKGTGTTTKAADASADSGAKTAAPSTAAAPSAGATTAAPADIDAAATALDEKLQRSAMWALIKKDFPDWYAARIKDAGKLIAEKKPDQVVTKFLVEQLVSLRRQNADQALSASTAKLKDVASAFLANLKALAARSTDACYSFISQGETSPSVIELLSTQGQNWPVETQVIKIFEAVSEGKKSRTAHTTPVKTDYDVLADQLAKIGWSQTDLQLFADPKALARSSPDKVCKMVQDWFTAHISIGDAGVQERLLVETLRPVVAG